jgi:hypothetical protein
MTGAGNRAKKSSDYKFVHGDHLASGFVANKLLAISGACVYSSSMKQLPGKTRPKWLVAVGQGIAAVVFVAMTASILPMLLIMSLVTALLLIPVLRQLRKEVEKTSMTINTPAKEEMIDITPLHNRLSQKLRSFLRRRP